MPDLSDKDLSEMLTRCEAATSRVFNLLPACCLPKSPWHAGSVVPGEDDDLRSWFFRPAFEISDYLVIQRVVEKHRRRQSVSYALWVCIPTSDGGSGANYSGDVALYHHWIRVGLLSPDDLDAFLWWSENADLPRVIRALQEARGAIEEGLEREQAEARYVEYLEGEVSAAAERERGKDERIGELKGALAKAQGWLEWARLNDAPYEVADVINEVDAALQPRKGETDA